MTSESNRPLIDNVAFGLRYQPHWRIADELGRISDHILRSGGTPFGPRFFPKTSAEGTRRRLYNPESGDSLVFSERECILSADVRSRDTGPIEDLARNFDKYVLSVLKRAGLNEIGRYGLLVQLDDCRFYLNSGILEHFLARDAPDAKTLDLRFTRRLPTQWARAKSGLNDFRNLIYLMQENDSGEVLLAIDYQELFDPELNKSELERHGFVEFVERGLTFFKNDFLRWIETFRRSEAA